MYDFDSTPSRIGTGSIKWDQYQDPEVIALSNADMDYLSAPCIREALIKFASGGQYGYTLKPDSYYDAITGWFCRRYNLKSSGRVDFTYPRCLACSQNLLWNLCETR